MFKRVRRRIETSEKEHKLGLTAEIKEDLGLDDTDSDSDESMSRSGSESSGSGGPSRKRKRPLEDSDEESDAGESGCRGNVSVGEEEEDSESDAGGVDDESSTEGGPTVEDALNYPLFFVSEDQQACVVCPRKLLKNKHMAELHRGATHHIRRYSRFKEMVERLSTQFDDTNSDFASNVVRVMDSVHQSKPGATSHKQSGMSKRALKKQNLARKRERQHKKKRSNSEAKGDQRPQEKEAIPEPKKPLKRHKLEAVEASHTKPNPKPSLPSNAPRLPSSTTSTSGRRRKVVKV